MKNALIGLSLAVIAFSGSASSQPARPPMRPELFQPGLVEVEPGRRLNLRCSGSGSPTVVFEQGGEGMIYNWAKVQPAVERMTRTCVYDRGGFGWSDPAKYPVTARSVTDDLRTLLERAGVEGAVVLVGHSVGGFYATMYADRFFDQVAGLVLVDPGFSGQATGRRGDRWNLERAVDARGGGDLLRCAELARAGTLTEETLAPNRCYPPPPPDVGAAARRYGLHAITSPNWYMAEHSQSVHYFSAYENGDLSVSHQQERDASRSFGDLPMVVLTAETLPGAAWETAEERRTFLLRWREGHAALAKRSSRGRHQVVAGAGHFIQLDQPDAVIEAVRDVLASARSR